MHGGVRCSCRLPSAAAYAGATSGLLTEVRRLAEDPMVSATCIVYHIQISARSGELADPCEMDWII